MVKSSAIQSPVARSWYRITEQNREDLIIVEIVFRFIEGCLISSVFQVCLRGLTQEDECPLHEVRVAQ